MKYTLEITIQKPIEVVVSAFDSVENMKHWQKGLISYEPISGDPGAEGSKSRLVYKMGKREIEMVETIVKKNLPSEFHGTYEADGVYNIQENYFEILDQDATKWISVSEFKFVSFTMKLVGFLMPGSFKKQSFKYMQDFKTFIEKGISAVA